MTEIDPVSKVCFVISPIGKPDSPERKKADAVFLGIIQPAAKACGYEPLRADHLVKSGLITLDVIHYLVSAPLVIAELTGHNPNVFYELAVRHSARKPVIQLLRAGDEIPFDVKDVRTINYIEDDIVDARRCEQDIIKLIKEIENNPDQITNPIANALDLEIVRNDILSLHEKIYSGIQQLLDILNDEMPFTEDDLLSGFAQIGLFNEKDVRLHLTHAMYNLVLNKVITKRQLKGLVSSQEVISILENLYREELKREDIPILDPMAIASWGAFLYSHGMNQDAIDHVRNQLRISDEYRSKH